MHGCSRLCCCGVVAYHYGISAGRDLVPDHVVLVGSFFGVALLGYGMTFSEGVLFWKLESVL